MGPEKEIWSDDEFENENIKMDDTLTKTSSYSSNTSSNKSDDLVFLLYCAFIFEKRTRPGTPSVDKKMGELSAWLTQSGKLRLDVEPCEASTLDFDDPDTPRIVDVLNTYSPGIR